MHFAVPALPSIGPKNGSYVACGEYIYQKCVEIGLNAHILMESKENKPIIVAEWLGNDPSLPCIFLNCHYDVVPVMESSWTIPAFDGQIRDGKIYVHKI